MDLARLGSQLKSNRLGRFLQTWVAESFTASIRMGAQAIFGLSLDRLYTYNYNKKPKLIPGQFFQSVLNTSATF